MKQQSILFAGLQEGLFAKAPTPADPCRWLPMSHHLIPFIFRSDRSRSRVKVARRVYSVCWVHIAWYILSAFARANDQHEAGIEPDLFFTFS